MLHKNANTNVRHWKMMAIMTRKMYWHTVDNCSIRRNHHEAFCNSNSTYLCKWFVNVSNHNQHSL